MPHSCLPRLLSDCGKQLATVQAGGTSPLGIRNAAVRMRDDGIGFLPVCDEVRTAYDGVEALQIAEEFHPEVGLLDIGMPKLDGYETARRLRRRPGGESMLLVAQTGWGQEDDKQRAKEAGFDRHLVKPLDPDGLNQLLSQTLESRGI